MSWDRVRILVVKPEGNPHAAAFQELAEVLEAGFRQLGCRAGISFNQLEPGARHVVLGWHLLPEAEAAKLPEGTVLYNLEQMDDANGPFRTRLARLASRFRIWDYSRRNIDVLKAQGFPAPVAWAPIGTCREMARIEPAEVQDIDVLFYGSLNDRRRAVLEGLQQAGARVHHAFNVYGSERDLLIARARIVLNLHYYDASIFEMVRVSYLLANGKAVVAECNPGTEVDADLAGAARLVPYGELVPACMELLRDPGRIEALGQAGIRWMAARPESEVLRGLLAEDGFRPPAVTVVVLTRDRPVFLARALASLRAQTFKDFEVVVVNDAGRDVSKVVAEAREMGLDIRLLDNPECRGQSASRNMALRRARGRWISYLDDDDLYYPDHLATLVETLRETGAKVAYTDSMRVVEEERKGAWVEVSRELAMSNPFSRERFLVDNITPINNVMHERACWEVAGPHDETFPVLEDWEFWIRLSRLWDFVHVPRATAEVRWRATGANVTFEKRDLFPPCRARIAARNRRLLRREALRERTGPPPREGFLFEPAWEGGAWVEILLAYCLAFAPGEPVTLILVLDPARLPLDQAQAMVLEVIAKAGRKAFPDVALVDRPGDLLATLRGHARTQWVPADPEDMEGPGGARFADMRRKLREGLASGGAARA